jgi:hypothetical protein
MKGGFLMNENDEILGDYIVVKALENGVQVIGMTRGRHAVPSYGEGGRGRSDDRAVYGEHIGHQDPGQGGALLQARPGGVGKLKKRHRALSSNCHR